MHIEKSPKDIFFLKSNKKHSKKLNENIGVATNSISVVTHSGLFPACCKYMRELAGVRPPVLIHGTRHDAFGGRWCWKSVLSACFWPLPGLFWLSSTEHSTALASLSAV